MSDAAVDGRTEPTLASPLPFDPTTLGDDLVAWCAEHFGVDLMPWQALVVGRLLAVDDDAETFRYASALVSVGRQNGKSMVMLALVTWRMCRFPELTGAAQHVLLTGHRLPLIADFHLLVRDWLLGYYGLDRFARENRTRGMQWLQLPNGSQLWTQAATPKAGHGMSLDLVVVDEAWAVDAEVVDEGLAPTQLARPHPQIVLFSTAGETNGSDLMQAWRRRGLGDIDADEVTDHLVMEWSVPDGLPADEPESWAWANPALGHTLTTRALSRAMKRATDTRAMERAHLNRWVTSSRAWLPAGVWDGLAQPEAGRQVPDGGTVAVEVRPDGSGYGAVLVAEDDDGMLLGYAHVDRDLPALVEWCDDAWPGGRRMLVGATLWDRIPDRANRDCHKVGAEQLKAQTAIAKQYVMGGAFRHDGSAVWAEQMRRAVAIEHSQTSRPFLVESGSGGPIELAKALVWAVADVTASEQLAKPLLVVASGT